MRVYYFFGRLLKPFLTAGFFFFCLLTRTPRVRVVAVNEKDENLLVKSWSSTGEWGFAGGGVYRGESFAQAACRELYEETGIRSTPDQMQKVGVIRVWWHDEVVFSSRIQSDELPVTIPHKFEIQETGWFADLRTVKLGPLAREIAALVAKKD